ncbi:hypothetical protein ACF06Q_09390 [Streptomyces leeuwenhoekii]|uniref:hypothetical protein n=1 Tax=Streptomyces leeuwenhoekii TaxID=1437453 RepID=UPI0036FA87B6
MTDQTDSQPEFTSPIAGRIEVREPCPWCADRPMIPRSLMDEHVARLHPEVQTIDAAADPAVQAPATDRAALRDRIAQALVRYDWNAGLSGRDTPSEHHYGEADAVLAVLPPTVDQATVLREAADELGRMDYDTDSRDYGYDTYRDAWNGGVMDSAEKLRRMADEAQPAETDAETATLSPAERTMLTYALDQAQEHIWSRDGFTDEDQAALDSLRRLAAEQPAAGARQDGADRG